MQESLSPSNIRLVYEHNMMSVLSVGILSKRPNTGRAVPRRACDLTVMEDVKIKRDNKLLVMLRVYHEGVTPRVEHAVPERNRQVVGTGQQMLWRERGELHVPHRVPVPDHRLHTLIAPARVPEADSSISSSRCKRVLVVLAPIDGKNLVLVAQERECANG